MSALRTYVIAEFRRELLLKIRYPAALAGSVIVIAMVYALVAVTGALLGDGSVDAAQLANPVENYRRFAAVTVWVLMMSGAGFLAHQVEEEAQSGALEYFFLSSIPSVATLLVRYLFGSLYSIVLAGVLLYSTHSLGAGPAMPVHQLLLLMLAIELPLIGAGFALCGATLRFKKLGALMAAVYLAIFLLVLVAYTGRGTGFAAQAIPAFGPIRALISDPAGATGGDMAVMMAAGAVALMAGIAVYLACVRATLRRGDIFLR
ncbi:hypothetical protein [Pseudoxanthomonas mexicana]